MSTPKVKIGEYELNADERRALSGALELMVRFYQGQFSELGLQFQLSHSNFVPAEDLRKVKALFEEAQKALFGNTSQSWRVYDRRVRMSGLLAHRLELMLEGNEEAANGMLHLRHLHEAADPGFGGKIPEENHE